MAKAVNINMDMKRQQQEGIQSTTTTMKHPEEQQHGLQ